MKSNLILIAAVILLASLSSCKKDNTDTKIIYPEKGVYGHNILRMDSIEIISTSNPNINNYSLRAELPSGTSLKIYMKKMYGGGNWTFGGLQSLGWAMDYNSVNGSVKMYAYGQSVSDADVSFFGSAVAKIYFYENNDTVPNRIKYISW